MSTFTPTCDAVYDECEEYPGGFQCEAEASYVHIQGLRAPEAYIDYYCAHHYHERAHALRQCGTVAKLLIDDDL